jgi:predicted dehydrogenase
MDALEMSGQKTRLSRRSFLKSTAGASAAAATFNILHEAHAANADLIKVGLIGCGNRGTGAAQDCLKSASNLKLIAMADIFKDHLDAAREKIKANKQVAEGFAVDDDHCFAGLDAYKQLLKTDCQVVLICSPIFFHPIHLDAAIEAGKHCFMEKAACVDAPGVRQIIATGQKARERKLNIAVGSQRRHQGTYLETIKRIQDGTIGEIVAGNAWWCGGGSARVYPPKPAEMSDVEFQIRSWYRFRWTCGDHIVEQHVHNLDVMMWVLGQNPIEARGMGSQLRRPFGDCYDNFAVDYVFPGEVHVTSMCRQINECWNSIGEFVVGTKGKSNCANKITFADGKDWQSQAEGNKAYIQEHTDLIAAVRGEAPYLNEAENLARSTLVAIMGRTSAYTGKRVTWEQAMAMQEKYGPKELAFADNPVGKAPVPPGPIPK